MLGFLCKGLLLLLQVQKTATGKTALDSPQFYHLLHKNQSLITFVSPFSSTSAASVTVSPTNSQLEHDFTVSYLIDSCRLSKKDAKSVSVQIILKTKENPDSVLNLFRNYGFDDTNISSIVKARPKLLYSDPDKTLKPKFEFFSSIGASHEDIKIILFRYPAILHHSLENHIIPSFEFLKSLLHSKYNVISSLRRSAILSWDFQTSLAPNVEVLRDYGVPESLITQILMVLPSTFMTAPARFKEVVVEVKQLGFDPSKRSFLDAIYVLRSMHTSIKERKFDLFRRWGWSDDHILLAFRKNPRFLMTSEKKIEKVMDFLVKMGVESSKIAGCPNIFMLSLEKRIIPRCSLIQILRSKGLIVRTFTLSTVFVTMERSFVNMFVTKHQRQIPELLKLYRTDVNLLGPVNLSNGRIFA